MTGAGLRFRITVREKAGATRNSAVEMQGIEVTGTDILLAFRASASHHRDVRTADDLAQGFWRAAPELSADLCCSRAARVAGCRTAGSRARNV